MSLPKCNMKAEKPPQTIHDFVHVMPQTWSQI